MATKKIPLTQNKFALVDAIDFDFLNKWKWFADKARHTWYAANKPRNGWKIYMHRVILARKLGHSKQVDHINGNGLDNRRCNLRYATNRQNHQNQKIRQNMVTKYKGIIWRKDRNKWQSRIYVNGRNKHLGYFENEIDAAKAYRKAAKRFFGEFAKF